MGIEDQYAQFDQAHPNIGAPIYFSIYFFDDKDLNETSAISVNRASARLVFCYPTSYTFDKKITQI